MQRQNLEKAKKIWVAIGPILLKRYQRNETFLDYQNPWQLSVAVTLSAQTTDDMVNKVTPGLFKKYPTPEKLAKGNIQDIEKLVSKLGFYRVKAKYIKAAADVVVKEFKGVIPHDPDLIQKMPGIGRKGAIAVISNAYPKYANIGIPVDTHVIRFVKRFGLTKATDPSKIEQDLLQIIPKKDWKRAGYAIKEYGRKEGKARGYKSEEDPLVKILEK
ncbi:MAG: endonuclease III [Candidatus Pacebacteria bacterium]|nr:endonuclease III [Candidatus Paceibacterota bacterium]MBP9701125.1 endonuclease III [Candidatus Paceibacterota bacterium]